MRGDILVYIQSILMPVTCVITYFMATSQGHVAKEFPYVSDTGTYPPESCIFGILLSIFSLTTFLTMYIRWTIVQRCPNDRPSTARVNNVSFFFGVLAAFGVLLVAHFQETSQVIVHIIGAFLAFFIGTVYMWMHTYLSYCMTSLPGSFGVLGHVRLLFSGLNTLSALLTVIFGMVSMAKKPKDVESVDWTSKDNGWDIHISSTSFEWAMIGLTSLFFLTFVSEFRYVNFGLPVVWTPSITDKMDAENGTNQHAKYGSSSAVVEN